MIRQLVSDIVDIILGRLLLVILLGAPAFGIVFLLTGGTDALVALGLSRDLAGTIAATIATLASIAGLAAFGYYFIDW